MTLGELTEKYNLYSARHKNGCYFVIVQSFNYPSYTELFHLSDFIVSTVSGITIWLIPRQISFDLSG